MNISKEQRRERKKKERLNRRKIDVGNND